MPVSIIPRMRWNVRSEDDMQSNDILNKYRYFIFDLYGTLLDIETDEHKPSLWRFMSGCYNAYGCNWKPKELHEAFFKADREERERLSVKLERAYREINDTYLDYRSRFDGLASLYLWLP